MLRLGIVLKIIDTFYGMCSNVSFKNKFLVFELMIILIVTVISKVSGQYIGMRFTNKICV
jgi:hypothetical protein